MTALSGSPEESPATGYNLVDFETNTPLRPATADEVVRAKLEARKDGGYGLIVVSDHLGAVFIERQRLARHLQAAR